MCQRLACHETACSFSNPGGACPNAGEACINGTCVASCDPNPCTATNRTTCEIKLGVPTCVCDEGTVEKDGKCMPKTVTKCPSGFACNNGYCANKSDPAFFCVENSDCGGTQTCSPRLPSGTCNGCTADADCPGGDEENSAVSCLSGYCIRGCLTNDECSAGMVCKDGKCSSDTCSTPSQCQSNYTCTPSTTGSANGTCTRIPCK